MARLATLGRLILGLLIVAAIGAVVVWRVGDGHGAPPAQRPRGEAAQGCGGAAPAGAAESNAASLDTLAWRPFGRAETGWASYAPLVARETGTPCPADTPGFAAALARWQGRQGHPADGVFKPQDFDPMRDAMNLRRPFVQQTAKGLCPAAPPEADLATAARTETYGGKPIRLRAGALAAYRRMVAAAHAAGVADGEALKLVSGYRGPDEEAARCADGGCNTLTRAHCSAHRTGLALDLYLDHLPGHDPSSTDDANRAAMSRSPAYRWLVANGERFGFRPYPFEPWHWEWTGEAP